MCLPIRMARGARAARITAGLTLPSMALLATSSHSTSSATHEVPARHDREPGQVVQVDRGHVEGVVHLEP